MAEKGHYTYDYPRPMVTVDAIIFSEQNGEWHVLLIQRRYDPYAGCWALPGGFVEMDEPLEAAAARELFEEAGVSGIALEQVGAFGAPGRDPRGRSIGVAFWGVAVQEQHAPRADDDAQDVAWFPVDALPPLAFDHGDMVACALAKMALSRKGK